MPGKISEYSNNGNMANEDLFDYSHENEPGSNNWETRSITLAQLKTLINASASDLPLGKADQLLDALRTVDGDTLYSLNIVDVTGFNVGTEVALQDSATMTLTATQVRFNVKDNSNNLSTNVAQLEDYVETTAFNTSSKEIIEKVSWQDGHELTFQFDEEDKRVIWAVQVASDKGLEGWFINTEKQLFIGTKTDAVLDELIMDIQKNGYAIGLASAVKTNEQAWSKTRVGSFWFNIDAETDIDTGARELSYIQKSGKVRRVAGYGQRGYIQKTTADTGNTFNIDCDETYNYLIRPVISTGGTFLCDLNFVNCVDGDFGNIIFDLTDVTNGSKFGLGLPNIISYVVNDGQGQISNATFPEGQIHTLTWTYIVQGDGGRFYFTYGVNYTN